MINVGNHIAVNTAFTAIPKAAYLPATLPRCQACAVPMAWAAKPRAKPDARSSLILRKITDENAAPMVPDRITIKITRSQGSATVLQY